MGHSKIPWKKKHHKILDAHGRLIADVRGACGFQEDEDNAKFIVTACNAHDTLKAKEALFDLIISDLDGIVDYWNKDRNDSAMFDALDYIEGWGHDILTKAKDLSK